MSHIQDLTRLDATYHERNQLAIALALMALPNHGIRSSELAGYGFDPATGRGVVYVTLPSGVQVSWHMSDSITRDWQQNGCTCLPLFSGKWDGTFVGREEGWPARHIQKRTVADGSVLSRVYESFAVSVSAGLDGKSYMSGFGVGVASEPKEDIFRADPPNATHYRICSGGNRRFYRKVDGTWLYYHQDDQFWHPTDLSEDYLGAHVIPISLGAVFVEGTTSKKVAEGIGRVMLGIAAHGAGLSVEYDTIMGVSWLVDICGRNTEYFVGGDQEVYWRNDDAWEPAAASSGWVQKSGVMTGFGSIARPK